MENIEGEFEKRMKQIEESLVDFNASCEVIAERRRCNVDMKEWLRDAKKEFPQKEDVWKTEPWAIASYLKERLADMREEWFLKWHGKLETKQNGTTTQQ